jgi:hypothetical protein
MTVCKYARSMIPLCRYVRNLLEYMSDQISEYVDVRIPEKEEKIEGPGGLGTGINRLYVHFVRTNIDIGGRGSRGSY